VEVKSAIGPSWLLRLALVMLPIIVQHLPRDRERMGLREGQMAGRLGLTLADYRGALASVQPRYLTARPPARPRLADRSPGGRATPKV
jgi:hypothetical protein